MLCTCFTLKISSAAGCSVNVQLWLQHLDPVASQKEFAATWKQKAIFYNPFTLQNMSQWLTTGPLSSSVCTVVRKINGTLRLPQALKLEVSLSLLVSIALLIFCNSLLTSPHADVRNQKISDANHLGTLGQVFTFSLTHRGQQCNSGFCLICQDSAIRSRENRTLYKPLCEVLII